MSESNNSIATRSFDRPLISVIVAVFNGEKTLQQCIGSVSEQSYANKELIIIDGGSNDGTLEIIKANREKIGYFISEPDRGIYHAWNKGLMQAAGEWVYFLGADDFLWDAQVLGKMVEALQGLDADTRVAYGRVMLINAADGDSMLIGDPWEKAKKYYKQVMSIPHQGVMHRRSLFDQHGLFDESFRIAGDYELLLRELKSHDAVFFPDIVTAGMRVGGVSSNPDNGLRAMREVRRAQLKHGIAFPGIRWITTMARIYIRFFLMKVFGERLARKVIGAGKGIYSILSMGSKT
jgi:glycosyltransferase involved in cell wall biosynthesis